MSLSAQQIAAVAWAAGLRDRNNLAIAVAVALAESGGDPNAHNARPPDDSYGLWQINMLGGMGPARRRQLGIASNEQLFDPVTNARAMMLISRQGKLWTPWTTFTLGRYLPHLQVSRAAATAVSLGAGVGGQLGGTVPPPSGSTGGTGAGSPTGAGSNNPLIPDVIEGTADAAANAARMLAAAGTWMSNRNNWLRVVYVIGGTGLLVTALVKAGAYEQMKKITGKAKLDDLKGQLTGAVVGSKTGGASKAAGGAGKAAGGATKAAAGSGSAATASLSTPAPPKVA